MYRDISERISQISKRLDNIIEAWEEDEEEDYEQIEHNEGEGYYSPIHGGPFHKSDPVFNCRCDLCEDYRHNEMRSSNIPVMRERG